MLRNSLRIFASVRTCLSKPLISSYQQQRFLALKLSDEEWRKRLTPKEYRILRQKDTEYPGTGEYNKHYEKGIYKCVGCDQELYHSSTKFDSRCGWPAFSSSIGNSVRREGDIDGYRIEILCSNCDGHLGHVFENEGFRDENGKVIHERHCVNSASLKFEPQK